MKSLKMNARNTYSNQKGVMIVLILLEVVAFAALTGTVLGAVLILPIHVGSALAFIKLSKGADAEVGDLVVSLRGNHYFNHVIQLFLRGLYTFLWSLLLFVPGIIKHYSYFLTPYILADDPEEKNPIEKSMTLMNGHKGELFLLQLSFIGWYLLGALTLGILTLLFVQPYYRQTMANYYEYIKSNQ